MRGALLVVRVLTEVALLAGAAWAGGTESWLLGALAAVAVAAVWGVWIAPKARQRLADPSRLALEVALFGATAVGLAAADHTVAGVVLGVAGVGAAVLLRVVHAEA